MTLHSRMARAAVAACIGAVFAAAAHAQDVYVKGELGGGFGDKYDDVANGDLKNNWRAGVGLGARVSPNIRLEGEYIHDSADFKTGGGDSRANLGMANAYYDFTGMSAFTPFVGAGIGGGQFKADGAKDSSVAYQLTAGAAKEFTPRVTGELAYKYLDAPNLTFNGTDTEYRSSFVTAGVRVKLGQ